MIPEAICPVCRASVRVRRDGCLREHTRPHGLRWRRRCEGSGRSAAPALPVDEGEVKP